MLIPFLAFFEKFKYVTTATLTPKRNTVPPEFRGLKRRTEGETDNPLLIAPSESKS